jgi:hypothetical protein
MFNQLALANPITAAYLQQQQKLLPNVFNQIAFASPAANGSNNLCLVCSTKWLWRTPPLLPTCSNNNC